MSEMVNRVVSAIAGELYGDDETWERAARAAIEAMRDVPEVCYDQYHCDKTWRELNSKEVWNLWLDAALK